MTELTLHEIMGEEHEIYVTKLDNDQILISVINESGDVAYSEETHQFAWDSLVGFAKQIIHCERLINAEEEGCDE